MYVATTLFWFTYIVIEKETVYLLLIGIVTRQLQEPKTKSEKTKPKNIRDPYQESYHAYIEVRTLVAQKELDCRSNLAS